MTKEEIKQKTSLCFLLNPNIPEEEKNCVIEKVMATRATIVSKAALCNIITYILKQIAELEKENSELKGIKDIATLIRANNDTVITLMQLNNMLVSKNQQLAKAKEIIKKFSEFVNNEVEFDPEHPQEHTDLWNELCEKAEQFLKESE